MRCRCGHMMAEYEPAEQVWHCWNCSRTYDAEHDAWDDDTADTCKVDGCDNQPHAKDLCMKHYRRWLRTGKTDDPVSGQKTCSKSGCDNLHHAQGYCMACYQSARRAGILLDFSKMPNMARNH